MKKYLLYSLAATITTGFNGIQALSFGDFLSPATSEIKTVQTVAQKAKQALDDLKQQASTLQDAVLTLPQTGSFSIITNNLPVAYQVKDRKDIAAIPKNSNLDTLHLWPIGENFSTLWDNPDSQTITFQPPPENTDYPNFTFKLNPQSITITRSAVSALTTDSWFVNLVPIQNLAKNIGLKGPKSWYINFTIDKNANIIIDKLWAIFYTYSVDETQRKIVTTSRTYTFEPNKTTAIKKSGQTVADISNTAPQGGLCGQRILEPTNPTCTATQ